MMKLLSRKSSNSSSMYIRTLPLLILIVVCEAFGDRLRVAQQMKLHRYRRHQQQQLQDESMHRIVAEQSTTISGRQSIIATDCVLNGNGLYGTIDGTATTYIYSIKYLYQVTVVSGTTETQLSNDIIRPLDAAITTAILPTFFDCDGDSNNRFLQAFDSSSGVVVTAISLTPVDTYVLSGCTYQHWSNMNVSTKLINGIFLLYMYKPVDHL
jgi:hypothetical protein